MRNAPDADDGDDENDGDESPFPACPYCGEPVLFSVGTGPHTGSLAPCGCSVPPTLIADLLEE